MMNSPPSRGGARPLKFSHHTGGHRRAVLIAALVLLIAGSAALVVWSLVRQRQAGPTVAAPPRREEGTWYQCAHCKHQFRLTAEQFEAFLDGVKRRDRAATRLVNCPKCGRKHCGVAMSRCPKCGGLYVPYGVAAAWKLTRGEPLADGARDVCPHCGVDVSEYVRAHAPPRER